MGSPERTLFDALAPARDAPVLPPDPLPDDVETKCGKCHCEEFKDTLIHNGRSLRRDCRNCGRTLGFPVWDPPREHERAAE